MNLSGSYHFKKPLNTMEEKKVEHNDWTALKDKKPDVLDVRIKLLDGSELNAWTQDDGDFWSEVLKSFIHESYVEAWKPLAVEKATKK